MTQALRHLFVTMGAAILVLWVAAAFAQWAAAHAEVPDHRIETKRGEAVVVSLAAVDGAPEGARFLDPADDPDGNWVADPQGDGQAIVIRPAEGFAGIARVPYRLRTASGQTEDGAILLAVRDGPAPSSEQVEAAMRILFQALVLAVLLQIALQRIFEWRFFIRFFEGRGVKAPVSVLLAWCLLAPFELDLIEQLMREFAGVGVSNGNPWLTQALSALLVSGGSATIFRVAGALNITLPGAGREESKVSAKDFARVDVYVRIFTVSDKAPAPRTAEIFVDGVKRRSADLKLVSSAKSEKEYGLTWRDWLRWSPRMPIEAGERRFTLRVMHDHRNYSDYVQIVTLGVLSAPTVDFFVSYPDDDAQAKPILPASVVVKDGA